jgi:hypothetical protein
MTGRGLAALLRRHTIGDDEEIVGMKKRHEDHEHEGEHPPPKSPPGRKLPKPSVPHLYGKTGIAGYVSFEERMPPER